MEKPSREAVLSEPAGERLDAWVAEFVMKSKVTPCETHGGPCGYSLWPDLDSVPWQAVAEVGRGDRINALTMDHYRLYRYSADIAAAWEVVEKVSVPLLSTKDGDWCLDRLGYRCCEADADGYHGEWRCFFSRTRSDDDRTDVFATGDTAPLAIVRAALLAVLDEE